MQPWVLLLLGVILKLPNVIWDLLNFNSGMWTALSDNEEESPLETRTLVFLPHNRTHEYEV